MVVIMGVISDKMMEKVYDMHYGFQKNCKGLNQCEPRNYKEGKANLRIGCNTQYCTKN